MVDSRDSKKSKRVQEEGLRILTQQVREPEPNREMVKVRFGWEGRISKRARQVTCEHILGHAYSRRKDSKGKLWTYVSFEQGNFKLLTKGFDDVYDAMEYAATLDLPLDDIIVAPSVTPSGAQGKGFAVFIRTGSRL